MATFLHSFPCSLETFLFSLVALLLTTLVTLRLRRRPKLRLPPSPPALPIFGNWLQVGDNINHENLSQLAKTYGDIFLLKMGQRNLVVVSSPELAKEVLLTQGIEFGSRTRNIVFDIFTGKGQDMTFTVYGDHWRKMRRIMMVPFFTNKVVQQSRVPWQEEIEYVITDLMDNDDAATSGVVIRHRLQLLMYNNLYRIMFNRRFEREDDPLFMELRRLNSERSRLSQSLEYNYGDFIPILQPLLRGYLQLCQTVKEQRLALLRKHFVDAHKKLASNQPPSKEKCAIDHILDAQKNGEFTEDNVFYILDNINVAALETTLWSIEWGLAELINNPNIQQRVRDEMNSVLGHGVALTEPDVLKLPYLNAVIKESLRLHMTIPLLLPHMNVQQAKLGKYDIPAESKILVNAWYLANNPQWWEKPEVFNPDRFLGPEKIEVTGNDLSYLPFGVGRRSCPGLILAMPIISLVLGRLVQSFELLPPPGQSKLDVTGHAGQFNFRIANHSTIVCKPL